ncbi:MAG: aminotransferase class I/II-fold pyridoxal phosphate-dependent enzyme [Chloroflexi bacterium]|jgi:aminotransferase|nr:aminotransferase class I/II-fold pyridoxal phosphate-dependent enzyme [Chloroflexota bacterium]MBT3670029.1 aminotransferase class I/II-fold pyridoxal phosphate-dependent enzyme [Chloroflexota bacterium]MBT4306769.1 aminotransferase class I/II-fold pyridoxal phosphate-dependent enzyme [Chloroflexota bacterium]MBT4532915.1 aminotransferase class I/II-fold pyridoxal phosphate-dependent enzyme [Chloroflexota bacterium]MBT4682182.1 aminotransferase class I/II-fold pyridoxal phosphate-dependent e
MTKNYLSHRVATLPPSGIRKFFDILADMPDVISLGIGEPDFVTPRPILEAGIQSLNDGMTQYTSNSGTVELRQALSKHLDAIYQVTYDPMTEMVITVGVSEALYLALTATLDPGDEVIIPTPCFVSYQAEVTLAGGVPIEIPSHMKDDFQPDVEAIKAAITPKTKVIFIGYPNNPTGAVASKEILEEIAKIAEEYDLLVISDEIYDQLVYGVDHVCFSKIPGMKERTILLGGFSKNYAMTGWRVGYACAPKAILDGMLRVHQYTIMSAPTMSQAAALKALEIGQEHVEVMRTEYDRRRRLIVDGFNRMGLETFEPRGAFYAFPKISSTGLDGDTFATRLLKEHGVAMVPGEAFGPGGEGFMRCSYATSYEEIAEALERIETFIGKL